MADLNLNIAYKTGVFAQFIGTTMTVVSASISGGMFEQRDVGRYIVFTTGAAHNYHRRIVSVTGDTTVTLNAPFGVHWARAETSLRPTTTNNVLANGRFTEPVPTLLDQFVVTYPLDELVQANPDGTFLNTVSPRSVEFNGTDRMIISPNVAVHARDLDIRFNASRDQIQTLTQIDAGSNVVQSGSIIFGDINYGDTTNPDINGYPTNSCNLIDTSTSFTGGNRPAGVWHQFGGSYVATGTTFVRANNRSVASSDAQVSHQLLDVDISGDYGNRISGDNSIVLGGTARGATVKNNTGQNIFYFNPLQPGLVSGLTIQGSEQAIYHFPSFARSTTVPAISVQDITGPGTGHRIIRGNHSGAPSPATTLTLLDWSIDELRRESDRPGTVLYHVDGSGGIVNLDFDKSYSVNLTDEAQQVLTEPTKAVLRDARVDDSVDIEHLTFTGTFSDSLKVFVAIDVTAATNGIRNFQAPNLTLFTPYEFILKARRRTLFVSVEDLSGPIGPVVVSFSLLPDINIPAADTDAIIDAYTELETAQKVYNAADLFKFNNPTLPRLSEAPFSISGDLLTTPYDVLLLNTSTSPANLIDLTFDTVNDRWNIQKGVSTVFEGGFNLTGTNTLDCNDNQIAGDVAASSVLRPAIFQDIPADRSAEFSFGGTVSTTLDIDIASGSTEYLVLSEITGHSLSINVAFGGTLVVVGPQPGDFATTGTTLDPASGITVLSGNVIAEAAETRIVEPLYLRFTNVSADFTTNVYADDPGERLPDVVDNSVISSNIFGDGALQPDGSILYRSELDSRANPADYTGREFSDLGVIDETTNTITSVHTQFIALVTGVRARAQARVFLLDTTVHTRLTTDAPNPTETVIDMSSINNSISTQVSDSDGTTGFVEVGFATSGLPEFSVEGHSLAAGGERKASFEQTNSIFAGVRGRRLYNQAVYNQLITTTAVVVPAQGSAGIVDAWDIIETNANNQVDIRRGHYVLAGSASFEQVQGLYEVLDTSPTRLDLTGVTARISADNLAVDAVSANSVRDIDNNPSVLSDERALTADVIPSLEQITAVVEDNGYEEADRTRDIAILDAVNDIDGGYEEADRTRDAQTNLFVRASS